MARRLRVRVGTIGVLLVAVALSAAVAGSVARLSADSSAVTGGLVRGCVLSVPSPGNNPALGTVRIVKAPETCKPNETLLTWSKGVATCPSGQVLQSLREDGTATCATDKGTTYTAGEGLTLNGTQFAVDLSVVQHRFFADCPHGSSIRATFINGAIACEEDSTLSEVKTISSTFTVVTGINRQGFDVLCPAGTLLTGGGYSSPSDALQILESRPNGGVWHVAAQQPIAFSNTEITVYALCIK
jgi:hypothetical protein